MPPLGRKNRELDAEELRVMSSLLPTPSSVTDHGGLLGLTDDDHAQYVHISAARTIIAAHTFSPSTPGVPFALGANAQGQLVTGLYADQLSKQVIAGAGLTGGGALTADWTLTLGTPSSDIASSTNLTSGTTHTHAVTASSSPGAAEALLKTDSAGLLTLVKAILGRLEVDNLLLDGNTLESVSGDTEIGSPGDLDLDLPGGIIPSRAYQNDLGSLAKKYRQIHAAELWVETLVAQSTLATIGGRILVGPTTTLTRTMAAADTTIYTKHNNLATGDVLFLEANGSFEAMIVTGGGTTGEALGPWLWLRTTDYGYTVTRNLDGSGANEWPVGSAVFNTGTTGDGFIDLYSLAGVIPGTTVGPTIVGNVRNSGTYNDYTECWAIGNLKGVYGYSTDTYGVGLGKYATSHLTIDPTNGIKFFAGAVVTGQWQPAGDLILGQVATNKSNLFYDASEGRLNFRGGTDGTDVSGYFDTDGSIVSEAGGLTLQKGPVTNPRGSLKFRDEVLSDMLILQWYQSGVGGTTNQVFLVSDHISLVVASGPIVEVYTDKVNVNTDLRVGTGLHVGAITYDPTDNDITADGGIYLGRQADPGDGNVCFTGVLKSYKNATEYTGYAFVPLAAPLTSTSWDGDAFSDTAKTVIDLSAVFSAPAGIKAVLMYVAVQDSGAAANDTYLILSPNNTAGSGMVFSPMPVDDRFFRGSGVVPCDANGDIYYQIEASGAGTFDVVLQIWGYWI